MFVTQPELVPLNPGSPPIDQMLGVLYGPSAGLPTTKNDAPPFVDIRMLPPSCESHVSYQCAIVSLQKSASLRSMKVEVRLMSQS